MHGFAEDNPGAIAACYQALFSRFLQEVEAALTGKGRPQGPAGDIFIFSFFLQIAVQPDLRFFKIDRQQAVAAPEPAVRFIAPADFGKFPQRIDAGGTQPTIHLRQGDLPVRFLSPGISYHQDFRSGIADDIGKERRIRNPLHLGRPQRGQGGATFFDHLRQRQDALLRGER